MKNLRKEIKEYQQIFELVQKKPCTEEENQVYKTILENGENLPEGVFPYVTDGVPSKDRFYTLCDCDLTEEEKAEYLQLKQLKYIKTIKNVSMFFCILSLIGLLVSIIIILIITGIIL